MGLACVNDGAATPRWSKDPFNEKEAAAVTKILDDKVCIPCIEKLFDYMYMSFEDASDDDKYLRTFMDAACSSAPNDDNEDMYCMPILKYAVVTASLYLCAFHHCIDYNA